MDIFCLGMFIKTHFATRILIYTIMYSIITYRLCSHQIILYISISEKLMTTYEECINMLFEPWRFANGKNHVHVTLISCEKLCVSVI